MPVYTDQLHRTVAIPFPPRRIVSLVPSQTELLADLSLEEEVVGITKFCVHPQKWFREKKRIGGTKTVNINAVRALQPDLIIANKEENVKEQVAALENHCPVWISDVNNLHDACQMIESIGTIVGKQTQAETMAANIRNRFAQWHAPESQPGVAYLIWKDPFMTVGGDTFIHHMLRQTGFRNVFGASLRYPQVSLADLQEASPDLLFLSSEPYPFRQKHINEMQAVLPSAKILLVDGEIFNWYGSRLLKAPAYFETLQRQIAGLM